MSFLNTMLLACMKRVFIFKRFVLQVFTSQSRFSTHVAQLSVDDAPMIAQLHAQGFAHGWDILEFQNLLCDHHIFAHGLFSSKRFMRSVSLIGFVLSRRALDEAEILTVTLAPTMRGKKLSAILLKPHLEALNHGGVREVFLEVSEHNHPAMRLYQRFGFEIIGRREAYYREPSGLRSAAITMRLTLEARA